jgi:DNA-binding transcriptional LysR family regulator
MMALERRVLGRDARLTGKLRVTMPAILATELLMPDLTVFTARYPDIELEVLVSYEPVNLAKREADVAIRLTNTPPAHLIGHRLFRFANAAYTSLHYWEHHDVAEMTWIGWNDATPHPPWIKTTPFPSIPVRRRLNDPTLQLDAVRAGMGIGWLPCFVADQDPHLRRLAPGTPTLGRWLCLLTHENLQSSARVQVFIAFMVKAFGTHRALIEGRCPLHTPVAPKGGAGEKKGKSHYSAT